MEQLVFEIIKFIYRKLYDAYYFIFIQPKIRVLLSRYCRYYAKLGINKKAFERKVWDFIRYNTFTPREDLRITLSLKTIIAAHAMQLAHHLPDEAYDYYDRIIIYKDYYLSRFTKKYHKAEVNPAFRVIVFSVRAIHESLAQPEDGLNVLLHEFAHALWLEHKIKSSEYTIFSDHTFTSTEELIVAEFTKLENDPEHFFRKYAFTDKAEFFAVAVENFFERPEKFKNEIPALYQVLTKLLRQDPLNLK